MSFSCEQNISNVKKFEIEMPCFKVEIFCSKVETSVLNEKCSKIVSSLKYFQNG